jgi:hypothetical protein
LDLCGKSCTYFPGKRQAGMHSKSDRDVVRSNSPGAGNGRQGYRDTDWYDITAAGGTVTYQLTGEFPVLAFLMYGLNCSDPAYVYGTGDPCVPVALSYSFSTGQHAWLWAGPSVFDGVPESDYVMHVTGLQGGAVPIEKTTWGRIKAKWKN